MKIFLLFAVILLLLQNAEQYDRVRKLEHAVAALAAQCAKTPGTDCRAYAVSPNKYELEDRT